MNVRYAGRDHARTILAVFTATLGSLADVRTKTRSWASATFVGERHTLSFVVADRHDLARFLDAAGELDIPLCCAFVADLSVTSVMPIDGGGTRVGVEVLVVEES